MPGAPPAPARLRMLDLALDNLSMDQALERILGLLAQPGQHRVCFLNAHCMNIACRDLAYRRAVTGCDLVLADGSGLALAGRLLGRRLRGNVNGTDLFPLLCQRLEGQGVKVYLLGGGPGVADKVARWLNVNFPGLPLAGWRHGFFGPEQEPEVIRAIARSGADLLLVAMGVPRQELWIDRNLTACGVRVGVAVGGLFDFYSGRIPRAPRWLRRLGLEWIWRLLQEPRRMWQRYLLGNALFIHRILAERRGASPWVRGKGQNQ